MNEHMAHLHVHTDASLRDGQGTVSHLLTTAKSLGFQQLAMTDHGTLANAVTFTIQAKRLGIKPIMGLEGYIYFDGTLGHITLLAHGNKGWASLLELNNIAHRSAFKEPAFSIDELLKHSDGLICLTGCQSSPLHQLSLSEAVSLGNKLKGVFGNRLYAEMMFGNAEMGWGRANQLAERCGLRRVITNDVHFAKKEEAASHPVLTRMKSGFDYSSEDLYLKGWDRLSEDAQRFGFSPSEAEGMLTRTGLIADRLGEVKLSNRPALPSVTGVTNLKDIIYSRPRSGYLKQTVYSERLDYELDIVNTMDYKDYFVILDDIIANAKRIGAKVGPGRGSGCGSLTLFLLGITDIDPIYHGLQFERFLNPERIGMPDVDVDIDSEKRDEVLAFANKKYGAVPIATYSRYSHRSLVRDLGKSFRIDKRIIDAAADGEGKSEAFVKLMADQPKFAACYETFMGQIRHKGKHAGGVIITDTPVPIERIGDGLGAAWTEGKANELSYAGIVKFDLLGLSVLSALRRLEDKFERIPEPPIEGSPVFSIFQEGDLAGIFQFSGSEGIRKLTMGLAPNKFSDLVAINALYRPGAIDAGSTEKFPEWKKKPREDYPHIADILKETYGAIVYQEQVMAIFQRTVGGTLAEADLARRMISKAKPDDPKWVLDFAKLRAQFIGRAQSDWSMKLKDATSLWDELATHSRYSFNKSHSAAYSMIAWLCAWWKYHETAAFYTAMLNVDPQQEQTYITSAVKGGIEIVPPHVNVSSHEWEVGMADNKIYMPLSAIKFLGGVGVEAIIAERKAAGGEFRDLEHFMEVVPKRAVNGRARVGLLATGGFKEMGGRLKRGELEKLLAVKELPSIDMEPIDKQRTYLGFIIPDKKLLKMMEEHEEMGRVCGIIKKVDVRKSQWKGTYTVYSLSPSGLFWTSDPEWQNYEVGMVVSVKMGLKSRGDDVKELRIPPEAK